MLSGLLQFGQVLLSFKGVCSNVIIFDRNSYIKCKQYRPLTDISFCGIQSGSALFARSGINAPRHYKTNQISVCPSKTQIRLGICPVWSESSLWVDKDQMFLHADSEDSDQAGRMPRLIWVFAGRTSLCWFCHVAAQMSTVIVQDVFCKQRIERFTAVYRNDPKFLDR